MNSASRVMIMGPRAKFLRLLALASTFFLAAEGGAQVAPSCVPRKGKAEALRATL